MTISLPGGDPNDNPSDSGLERDPGNAGSDQGQSTINTTTTKEKTEATESGSSKAKRVLQMWPLGNRKRTPIEL
jgi:hypothetical protein